MQEDFTNSVSLLLGNGRSTLVDIDAFDELCRYRWIELRVGSKRHPRAVRYGPNKKNRIIYLHRQILGFPEGKTVDHINRVTSDNRKKNLRVCSVRENNLNRPGNHKATSTFKGVAWSTAARKWKVITGTKNKRIYLGSFDCEVEAARTYNDYAKSHFGPTAYLNPV